MGVVGTEGYRVQGSFHGNTEKNVLKNPIGVSEIEWENGDNKKLTFQLVLKKKYCLLNEILETISISFSEW